MQKSVKKMLAVSAAITAGTMAVAAFVLFGSGNAAQAQVAAAVDAGAWDHRGPITGTMHMTGTKPFTGTHVIPGFALTETKVISVAPGSPAATAGIVVGDVIVKVDDVDASPMALNKAVMDKTPGDTISLVVKDASGASRTLEVTLAENPNRAGVAYLGIEMAGRGRKGGGSGRGPGNFGGWDQQGQQGQRTQPDQQGQNSQPNQQNPRGQRGQGAQGGFAQVLPDGVDAGILVMNVTANSPAAAAGLTGRDVIIAVNGSAPTGVQAFVDSIGAMKVGDKVTLKIYRPSDQTTSEISVTLGESATTKGKAFMGVTLNGRMIQRNPVQQPVGTGA